MTTSTLTRAAALLAAVAAAVTATACTASAGRPAVVTSTVVQTSTAPPSSIAPVSEAPLAGKPVQEVEAPGNACPYITNDAARAAEGDRVGRVTLTTSAPPGCNFYWPYQDKPMVLQIAVTNYPSQTGAYNAMIRSTVAAPERIGVPGLIARDGCTAQTAQDERPEACVDAVLYRTTFFPPDGNQDWAAVFAVNSRLVTVKTRQDDTSFNAKNVATQIAPRF